MTIISPPTITTRHMIRADLPTVLDIENRSSNHPWREEDFIEALKHRRIIAKVCCSGGVIAGHLVYQSFGTRAEIVNLTIDQGLEKLTFAQYMVDALRRTRKEVGVVVREDFLDVQLFFKALGFTCTEIVPQFHEGLDAYYLEIQGVQP